MLLVMTELIVSVNSPLQLPKNCGQQLIKQEISAWWWFAILNNPDAVNNYFAKIASKETYDRRKLERFLCERVDDNFESLTSIKVK